MQEAAQAVSGATHAAAAAAAPDGVAAASQAAHTGLALVFDKLEYGIMVPLVYLALGFLLVALVVRIAKIFRSPPPPYQLAVYPERRRPVLAALGETFGMPQILKRSRGFWVSLILFHLGFLLLILGHLDILSAVNLVPPGSRHMLGAGGVGLMVTLPTFWLIGRRFKGTNRQISIPSDYLLLLLLLFTFLLGDLISWGNSWTASGFVMTKQDFAKYFDGLAAFSFADPRAFLHGAHYHMVVLHVLLAELVFIVLPFSKIMHAFLALPINVIRRRVWNHA
jgi:nitrate reductase gamma subunit